MVGEGVAHPVLDHVGLLLEDGEAGGGVVGVVAHLDLQGGGIAHDLEVVRLEAQRILEALGSLLEILALLVNGSASVPAEQALHLALQQRQLTALQRLRLLPQGQLEQRLQSDGLWVIWMRLQQLLCVLEALLVVLGVVVFLGRLGGTASCL